MGFLAAIPPKVWEYLAILLALGAFGGFMYYRGGIGPRAETATVKAQFAAFQGQVKALGKVAQKAADARKAADQLSKEQADAQAAKSKADLDSLYAAYRKLRQSAAGSSGANGLSVASGGTQGAAKSCLDTAAVNRALSSFDAGITGLLEEGDGAIADLNAARQWASKTLH